MSLKKQQFLLLGALALFFSILYFNYLKNDPILERDDKVIIQPLTTVTGVSDYVEKVKSNAIPDVQPVRDLSLLMNIKIYELTGITTFHLTNLLLFFLLIYLFSLLLETLNFSPHAIFISILVFSVHPLMISSVGWISARKHSLALCFLLIALISFLRKKALTSATILFASLSFFTHQIFILFPVWILLYSKIKRMQLNYGKLIFLFSISGLVFFLGTYKTFYLAMGNVTYQTFSLFDNISRYILSTGRSFTLILMPISIAGAYFQGSIYNIIGIPLLIVTLYLFYKSKNREDTLLWLALAASAHILTYIAFINDTYLYLPLMCFIVSINFYLKEKPIKIEQKWQSTIWGILVVMLGFKTVDASQMWQSDLKLWHYSHENEESPYSAILLGSHLMKHDPKTALELIRWGAQNFQLEEHLQILLYFLKTIYTSPLPIQQKIKILEECSIKHEIYQSYLGLAYLEGNWDQMEKGIQILKLHLKSEQNYSAESEGFKIIASIKYLCKNFPGKEFACQQLNISY